MFEEVIEIVLFLGIRKALCEEILEIKKHGCSLLEASNNLSFVASVFYNQIQS